ncbi:FAST kinase domain-containing protein 5, mitochondrial-like [Centruroides vittatus]|uniref:FAST kinase domain-containing protein 5, mitochondrial-like n=1 Tax=Centruroides vittatus TaxID=120091 RepID=UPI00350F289F
MEIVRKCILLKLFPRFNKIKHLTPINILCYSYKNINTSNLNRYNVNTMKCAVFNTDKNVKFRKFDSKYFDFLHQNDLYKDTTVRNINPVRSDTELLNTISLKNKLKLSDDEVKESLVELIYKRENKNKILPYFDEECVSRVVKWKVATSLYFLDIWMLIDEQFTLRGKFFNVLKNLWCTQIHFCTKENLVQMIYYLGRSKTLPPTSLIKQLESALIKNSASINFEEWGIVCTAFFKMKIKIKSEQLLHKIINFIKNNIWIMDRFDLISMLKVIRQSCHYDEDFFNLLKDYVKKECWNFTLAECVHILAAFANVRWYDNETFKYLEAHVMKYLKEDSTDIRLKDISKFLWAVSHVSHTCQSDNFFFIIIKTINKFNKITYKNYHQLVDCVHSLIILNYYDNNIISKVLSNFLVTNDRDKPMYQLHFIDYSIKIENPQLECIWLPEIYDKVCNLPLKTIYKDINERCGYEDLLQILQSYCNGTKPFQSLFILPHILLSSICLEVKIVDNYIRLLECKIPLKENLVAKNNKENDRIEARIRICFELLDESVTLRSRNDVIGLMKTKIRQLNKLDYRVITITPEAIVRMKSMSKDDLKSYLDHIILEVSKDSVLHVT